MSAVVTITDNTTVSRTAIANALAVYIASEATGYTKRVSTEDRAALVEAGIAVRAGRGKIALTEANEQGLSGIRKVAEAAAASFGDVEPAAMNSFTFTVENAILPALREFDTIAI